MSEFSKIVEPETIQARQRTFHLAPDSAQRAAIAKRLEVPGLPEFTADIALIREQGSDILRLTGHIQAKIVQRCVSTLEPVESEIDYPFIERYTADIDAGSSDGEIVIDQADDLDIDTLPPDGLDVADITVQHLSLALDPYPRSPAADDKAGSLQTGDGPPSGPFAKLALLKGGRGPE